MPDDSIKPMTYYVPQDPPPPDHKTNFVFGLGEHVDYEMGYAASEEEGRAKRIEEATLLLLYAIGEDPEREGLRETPARVARAWLEFANYDAGSVDTAFESVETDQMVVLKGIRVYSICEHHLLPFWADVSIAYLTGDKVLGISKLARIAQKHAHKLQLQERLTQEIADEVAQLAATEHVAVHASGQHLCMQMRGIRSDATMVTQVVRGVFREDPRTKSEFLSLVQAS